MVPYIENPKQSINNHYEYIHFTGLLDMGMIQKNSVNYQKTIEI